MKPENVLLAAGSGEILDVVGTAFASNKKVVGVEPSYGFVYSHVASVKGGSITLPLTADYRQDIAALDQHDEEALPRRRLRLSLQPEQSDGAHRHEGGDQTAARRHSGGHAGADRRGVLPLRRRSETTRPSVPYVLEGRPVIVTRTFSKIAALAGMRLGYAIATPEIIAQMRPFISDSISAVVKWGGVAALKDTAAQAHVKQVTLDLRKKATADLESLGFSVIPSETNFFMVASETAGEAGHRGVREAGRSGGPSVPADGSSTFGCPSEMPDEMKRFAAAFRDIMLPAAKAASGSR